MAIENLNFVVGHLAAAANYSATGQYRGMVASASADHTAVLASVAGQQIMGILRNEPEAGEACEIVIEGIAKAVAGGAIVRGDRLSVDANGALVASTGAGAIVGTALESAASTLIRIATVGATGRIANTRPMSTKNGLPGGWGRPST